MVSNYKFQIEFPSTTDLFDSKSHEQTAKSVFNTLYEDNSINIVGLEGELGSGKSTVIELIKIFSSQTAYKFIEFDVERFQHGATKKALIETIYDEIKDSVDGQDSKERVKKAKNVALGNHFEYTSEVNSDISIWIVWFAVSVLMAARVLPQALVGIGNFLLFTYDSLSSWHVAAYKIDIFAIICVLIILLPLHILYCAKHRKRVLFIFETPPSTGDIFKRNSIDTINETIEINKEVGAFELQKTLSVFVSELPASSRFILVIDNLDRVTSEKLREVWSDIEVFTSIAHNKIQLVLPYSRTHIASSLMDRKDEGREFISKRIPVTFRVSPIVTADWKTRCEHMIHDSLESVSTEESKFIIQLISLWSEFQCKQITPRYLKMIVNSVVSVKIVDTESVSLISAFYYQLAHQCCEIPMVDVLSRVEPKPDGITEHVETTEDPVKERNKGYIQKSWDLIEKSISFEECSKDLVSIHYQTRYLIAESEILRSPLEAALENANEGPFIEKRNIYGYEKIVNEILSDNGTEQFIQLVLNIKSIDSEESKHWIETWLPRISNYIDRTTHSIRNFDSWIEARIELHKTGLELSIADVKREFAQRNSENTVYNLDELKRLHKLNNILDATPNAISNFDAALFVDILWPNRDIFSNWNIEDITLDEAKVDAIFEVFKTEGATSPTLLRRISSVYRLGWMKSRRPLESLVIGLADNAELEENPENIENNVFAANWYNQEQINHYVSQLSDPKNKPLIAQLAAQATANIVFHSTYTQYPQLQQYIILDSEFTLYIADYLAISCDFKKLLQAISDPNIGPVIGDALRLLIEGRRIHSINITETISSFAPLQSLGLENLALIKWLEGWAEYYKPNLATLSKVNHSFVKAVFESSETNKFRIKFLELLSSNEADENWWQIQLTEPNKAVRHLFDEYFPESNSKFVSCAQLAKALKNFFSAENEATLKSFDNPVWIDAITNALPTSSVDSVSRALEKELNRINGSVDCQYAIIRNYGKRASLNTITDRASRKHVLTLFENASMNNSTAEWFDVQNFSFDNWETDLLNQFLDKLIEYEVAGFKFSQLKQDSRIQSLLSSRKETEPNSA